VNPALASTQPAHTRALRALLYRPRLAALRLCRLLHRNLPAHVRRPKELEDCLAAPLSAENSAIFHLHFPGFVAFCTLPHTAFC